MTVQEQDQQQDQHKLGVFIAYNGMNASFDYNPERVAEVTRVHALDHYDIHGPDRERDFLFGPDNQSEIKDETSMGSQVQPGSQLYLRARSQSGGSRR
jgi:hypothetical protein